MATLDQMTTVDLRARSSVPALSGNWAWVLAPPLHFPTRVIAEAVRQTGRWRPASSVANMDYDEIAGQGYVQCSNCTLGVLDTVVGRRRMIPLEDLSAQVSHRCQLVAPATIHRLMRDHPLPTRPGNRIVYCRFARIAFPTYGCHGTMTTLNPQWDGGDSCDFCDASGQECHACHWIARVGDSHYCSSCLAARQTIIITVDVQFLPPDGLLRICLRQLSGETLGEMELSQLCQRRAPDEVELYRIIVQVVIEARFLGPDAIPAFRVAPNGYCYSYDSFQSHYRQDALRQWIMAALRMVSITFVGTEEGDRPWALIDFMDGEDFVAYSHDSWAIHGGMGGLRRLIMRAHANRNPFEDRVCDYIPPLWGLY